MNISGPDHTRIPSSAAEAAQANRAFGKSRAAHRMRGHFIEGPDYLTDNPGATVTDIREARGHQNFQGDAEDTGALGVAPLTVNAEGEIDPRHHRIREARAGVDAARETLPQAESSIEDILGLAA